MQKGRKVLSSETSHNGASYYDECQERASAVNHKSTDLSIKLQSIIMIYTTIGLSSAAVATGSRDPACCNSVYSPHTEYEYVNTTTYTYAAQANPLSDNYFLRFITETLNGY